MELRVTRSACESAPGRPIEDQKVPVLHSRVSPEIYALIEDAEEFPAALNLLKEIYIKPVNQVYARYQLATRRQIPGESLDDFFNALTILGRNCDCPAVTANEHTDLLIRDAYVAGLASSQIRQRLLGKDSLGLTEVRALAASLDVASQNARAYAPDCTTAPWAPWTPAATDPPATPTPPQACAARIPDHPGGPRCYFCGQPKHPRQRCPARSATCKSCGKKGHYAAVCQSRGVAAISGEQMGPRAQPPQRPTSGQRAPPFWTPDTTRGGLAPPSSYPRAACDPWERAFCPPPTACDPWTPPSWLTGKDPGVDGSTLPEDNDLMHQPRLASVTLDQSRPRTLQTTTTKVLVNGHETLCLIDSGSTESFIHPDTEVLLWNVTSDLAGGPGTHPAPETCAGAQIRPAGGKGTSTPRQPAVADRTRSLCGTWRPPELPTPPNTNHLPLTPAGAPHSHPLPGGIGSPPRPAQE
ncbi:uncharacterized protein [Scyliorhinus torazame]|uniref:uncharacterized protein n=1 Tax=Scyliorhinus torazame TaxID=75743 RepID=UPI003B58FF93